MIKQKFTLDEETGYWVVLQFPAKEKEKAEEDVRKICPHCGALNEHLDLNETSGLFVCCNCQCLINVFFPMVVPSWFVMTKN